jgi:hypothetical protein
MHCKVTEHVGSDAFDGGDWLRPWRGAISPSRIEIDGLVEHREDLMATCYAHLRNALSVIEELLRQPEASPSDSYCYHQASGCVWVALVALGQCGPDAPSLEMK